MSKKVTRKNLKIVLENFTVWALAEPTESQTLLCKDLNVFLDMLGDEDAFGTEGQLDPRGDQRD